MLATCVSANVKVSPHPPSHPSLNKIRGKKSIYGQKISLSICFGARKIEEFCSSFLAIKCFFIFCLFGGSVNKLWLIVPRHVPTEPLRFYLCRKNCFLNAGNFFIGGRNYILSKNGNFVWVTLLALADAIISGLPEE